MLQRLGSLGMSYRLMLLTVAPYSIAIPDCFIWVESCPHLLRLEYWTRAIVH